MKVYFKFVLVLLFAQFKVSTLSSQSINQLELRAGLILFDSKVAEGDLLESAKGWGSQADLTLFRTFDIKRRFKPIVGVGYTNFYYWNEDIFDNIPMVLEPPYSYSNADNHVTSHYLNIKYGLEFDIFTNKLAFNIMGSHYLLLHKELQGLYQNRMFMNVDLGFRYSINSNFSFSISTPFTIHPIVQDPIQRIINNNNNPYFERFVEMNGLLIGVIYNFNKNDKNEKQYLKNL